MGGPRRSQSSFVSKRRSEDAVISGDSGKSCNLRGIPFVNATMLVEKYISPMLGLTPIYEISVTLQPGTIYSQPRLSASKLSATLRNGNFDPTSSLTRLQLAARTGRARLSKDIPPIRGILTYQGTRRLRGI